MDAAERIDTVVIGGGQAGLAVGYHLAQRGRRFMILDAQEQVGDAWRTRWDSLRLFTPAHYDGLPGMPFPARGWSFPTKDEMADYLEAYAERFDLPITSGVYVDGLSREGERYVVRFGEERIEASNVIVATGAERTPKVPGFAHELTPGIVQMHSSEYRRPSQLVEGSVLVVGAGNSGAEIAFELVRTRACWLSGPDTGHIPVRHGSTQARLVLPLIKFFGHQVVRVDTRIGRRVAPKVLSGGDPLIRLRPKELLGAGIERVGRTVGVEGGRPVLEDGRVLDAANVIWCTGFRSDFGWIDLPVFDEDGEPVHRRGVVESEPGLYFMGLVFQYALTSDVIPGVGRDAEHVAAQLDARDGTRSLRTGASAAAAVPG